MSSNSTPCGRATLADIPNVDEYGHIIHPGWSFSAPMIRSDEDRQRLEEWVAACEASQYSSAEVCHLVLDLPSWPFPG